MHEEDQPKDYLEQEKAKLETVLYNQWHHDWDRNEHEWLVSLCQMLSSSVTIGNDSSQMGHPYGWLMDLSISRCSTETVYNQLTVLGAPGKSKAWSIMFHCPLYNEARSNCFNDPEDNWITLLENEMMFTAFSYYVTEVFRIRREYLQTPDSSSPPPRCRPDVWPRPNGWCMNGKHEWECMNEVGNRGHTGLSEKKNVV